MVFMRISPATDYVLSGSAGKDAKEELIRRASTHDCKSDGGIATLNLSSELSDVISSFKEGYSIKTDEIPKDNDNFKSYFAKKGKHFCKGFISRVNKDLSNNHPFSKNHPLLIGLSGLVSLDLTSVLLFPGIVLSPLLPVTLYLDKRYEKSIWKREGPAYTAAKSMLDDYAKNNPSQ